MASPLPLRRSFAAPGLTGAPKEMALNMHHFHFQDLAKDAAGLTAGFTPLAFLVPFGGPAVVVSLLNILVFALLRYYDIRTRSRERIELARLKLELESARRNDNREG
jgi:hypothetical protein